MKVSSPWAAEGGTRLVDHVPQPLALATLLASRRRQGAARQAETATPLPVAQDRRRPARVCIATADLLGPVKNGGVGTACRRLAECLAEAGHDVTVLYVGPFETGDTAHWQREYAGVGIKLVAPEPPPFPLEGPLHARMSYRAFLWLGQQAPFDVIHFPELYAVGFYALAAKRLGLAFHDTTLAVTLHSPTLWHRLENREHIAHSGDLELDVMERECVAHADVLVSPTEYLLDWVTGWGFALPTTVHVQPNVLGLEEGAGATADGPVTEVVFFGRLETRKGLELFCDTVDRLDRRGGLDGVTVTFLGKLGRVGEEDGASYARRRASATGRTVHIETSLGQQEALAYLRSRRVLAVMPSLADNMPYTVAECLAAGVPFVATGVGGIPEMILPEDQPRALASPDPEGLGDTIMAALASGAPRIRAANDPAAIRRQWVGWHDLLTHRPGAERPRHEGRPLVSVCMATRNREAALREALDSLRYQTYSPIEVILVDDASDERSMVDTLERLDGEFAGRGWSIERLAVRSGPAAARNAAATRARGEFLLFMDDDNLARPEEIERFVDAAQHSGLPLLTCLVDHFRARPGESRDPKPALRWLPLGPAVSPGLFANQFGDTNFFIRRETFFELGGFDEDGEARYVEDWLFLSRAALAGVPMAVLPEPLFWYRSWPEAHGQGKPGEQTLLRRLVPYLYEQPVSQRGLLLYAAAAHGRLQAAGLLRQAAEIRSVALASRFTRAAARYMIGTGDGHLLRAERDLEVLPGDTGIRLRVLGPDPIAWLPVGAPPGVHTLIRIEMTAPQHTWAQFFWCTKTTPTPSEEQSTVIPVVGGRQVIWAEVPAADHVGCLRFDPGCAPGEYVLHSLEIRCEIGDRHGGDRRTGRFLAPIALFAERVRLAWSAARRDTARRGSGPAGKT